MRTKKQHTTTNYRLHVVGFIAQYKLGQYDVQLKINLHTNQCFYIQQSPRFPQVVNMGSFLSIIHPAVSSFYLSEK